MGHGLIHSSINNNSQLNEIEEHILCGPLNGSLKLSSEPRSMEERDINMKIVFNEDRNINKEPLYGCENSISGNEANIKKKPLHDEDRHINREPSFGVERYINRRFLRDDSSNKKVVNLCSV